MFEKKPLGEVIAFHTGGGTPPRQVPSYWNGKIPWASVKDFTDETETISSTQESISQKGLNASASNLIPAGTPLVCTRMAVGRTALSTVPMAINQDVKALHPATGITPGYLIALLQYTKPLAEAKAIGSTVKGIRIQDYLDIAVPQAPSTEQPKITAILFTLNKVIHQTEAIVEKLKQVKQGLLHDLLTRGVDANGELRPSYEEAPHLYQDSPLGWIPKEWGTSNLESISSVITSGSRDWAQFYSDNGPLFIRIGNLTREHINFRYESLIYVHPPENSDGLRTKLETGDILISITADLGIIGVVPDDMGGAYINQHIALIRPNQEKVNSRFIGHLLNSSKNQIYISKLNDSGAKSGLNLPTVRGIEVTFPVNLSEQDLIATQLDEVDRRIEKTKEEVAKLKFTKSALMDDLLTGRVRVTPLLQGTSPTPKFGP